MLKIDFLVFYYMETVGVKWPGLEDTNFKLSDTLLFMLAHLDQRKKGKKTNNKDIWGFFLLVLLLKFRQNLGTFSEK